MRRILIICNTPFQVIVAIQLRLTLFKTDEVDVHISDHSINAKLVAERLSRIGLFHDVRFQETKAEIASSKSVKALRFAEACLGARRYASYPDYDEILFYNLNMPVYHVADSAENGSKRTVFSGMEEGILSYGRMAYGKSPELLDRIRSFTGYPQIKSALGSYYCFVPELFRIQGCGAEPIRIPSVRGTLGDLKRILIEIYDYEAESIRQRFIFFASSSDVDGCGFGETELVMKLADLVGKENILVKMHPRDGRSVYSDAGLDVMGRSDVPWEVVHICGDADRSICMTVTSGAFINSAALLGSAARGVFWRLNRPENTGLNNRMSYIESTLRRLHRAGVCANIQLSDEIDIPSALRSLIGNTAIDRSGEGAV